MFSFLFSLQLNRLHNNVLLAVKCVAKQTEGGNKGRRGRGYGARQRRWRTGRHGAQRRTPLRKNWALTEAACGKSIYHILQPLCIIKIIEDVINCDYTTAIINEYKWIKYTLCSDTVLCIRCHILSSFLLPTYSVKSPSMELVTECNHLQDLARTRQSVDTVWQLELET